MTVAKTFATFCERFTDVCSNAAARTQESDSTATDEASTTEDSNSRATGSSNSGSGGDDAATSEQNTGPVTVTVSSPAQPSETGNDASSARVAFGAVLAAVAALAIAL